VEKVRATLEGACRSCAAVLKDPGPQTELTDMLADGLKWSITVWAETQQLGKARDQAIAAVRDALRLEKIGGPTPVTTVRLLDRPA
jgi:small-conductance mechanosensitive channel